MAIATSNARDEVKHEAHYIMRRPGRSGTVREVVELVRQAKGIWQEILKKYEIG
jgi:3-deoxy-D-manno-octulosonate 8-phosphate phosphatase KdsC-like HAD superfamily phosphatase